MTRRRTQRRPRRTSKKADAKADDKTAKKDGEKTDDAKKDKPKPVAIDIDGLDARVVPLPPKGGNYNSLAAVAGKVLYRRLPRAGSGEKKASIVYYDLEEREEKTVLEGADAFIPTADGKKLFVLADKKFGFIEVKEKQKIEKALRTSELEATVDPKAEWSQMFADAFRFQRDFFYDPGLHGVDWPALRTRYQALIDSAVTRWDVNFVLGDFMGELNASHTYRGGGDVEKAAERGVGLLGVDWALENGAYRIAHIAGGASWDVGRPLAAARSRRQREGGRLRARRQRRAAAHRPGSAGRVPGPGRQDGDPHGQRHAVDDRRAPGDGALPRRRHADALPRVDRGAPRPRRQGDERRASATSTCRAPASTRRTS